MNSQLYFETIQRQMVRAGFAWIDCVEISTPNGHKYHVDVPFARVTSAFYHIPGQTVLVKILLSECRGGALAKDQTTTQYIHEVEIIAQFQDWDKLLPIVGRSGPSTWDKFNPVPFFKTCPKLLDLDRTNGSFIEVIAEGREDGITHPMGRTYTHEYPRQDVIPADRLVRGITQITTGFLPCTRSGARFSEMEMTSFAPSYVFPECEEAFWSKFDMDYFCQAVARHPQWTPSFNQRRRRAR